MLRYLEIDPDIRNPNIKGIKFQRQLWEAGLNGGLQSKPPGRSSNNHGRQRCRILRNSIPELRRMIAEDGYDRRVDGKKKRYINA